jgi:pimeloyl-ACP methyl ester carboxylesterase
MATYVLVPGAGGDARYWQLLVPELRRLGHDVVAVDLPGADESAGLAEYADRIVDAIGDRPEVVLVAQSLGGFSAPLVVERVPVDLLVMLNAMVPAPGETAGDWWANTGQAEARAEAAARDGRPLRADIDVVEEFFHDVPADITAAAMAAGPTPEAAIIFTQPWPLKHWPDVPTRFLQARDDRLFPLEFQRRVVHDRLGIPIDELPGGHLVALSQPRQLAGKLHGYLRPKSGGSGFSFRG